MRTRRRFLLVLGAVTALGLAIAAVLLHSPSLHRHMAAWHGNAGIHASGPASALIGDSGGDPGANARARQGVADIGRRWDEAAYEQTVELYSAVHRSIEWPGVLAAETFSYGTDARQTLALYRPEQGFSEPGPVFLFLSGNGLGNSSRATPGNSGSIYSHLGKLAATAGGIGILMSYRNDTDGQGSPALEPGAEDLSRAVDWIVSNVADYSGDPGTIVLVASAEAATVAAAYLFNEDWQNASGHGIAAAILTSGLFGDLAPQLEPLVTSYNGSPVPLALWSAEYDTTAVSAAVVDLHALLCRKYGSCPTYEQIDGHNQVSTLMSLGTADTDVMNRFIGFYHTVR